MSLLGPRHSVPTPFATSSRVAGNPGPTARTAPVLWLTLLLLSASSSAQEPNPGTETTTGSTTDSTSGPATATATATPITLAIGDALPDDARTLELADTEGASRPLADWRREHGLLVIFSSNTCPYVTDWVDRFPKLAALGLEREIGMVVVNSNARKRKTDDSIEAMRAFARDHLGDLPYLVDRDSELADLLAAERTPEALLFDEDWRLVYRGQIDDHSGPFAEVDQHFLSDAMGALLDGGPMPEATAPLGCKILRPRRRAARSGGAGGS